MKLKTFYVRAAAPAAAALFFLYPYPAHAADSAALQGQVSPAQRDAVHFSLQRGFSHPEIAHIMGLPLGTVKTHVLRGRQKLQELLSDWQEGFGNDKA